MEFRGGRGGQSLASPPSLIARIEARGVLCAGKKKKVLVSTVCAYAGFHETVNYTGYFCHN